MRDCQRCGETKSDEEFASLGGGKRRSRCKACCNEQIRAWRANNPEKVRAYGRKNRAAEDPATRALRHRAWKLKAKYGITVEEFEWLLEQQGGGCAICSKPLRTPAVGEGKGCRDDYAVVDHDHASGRVRGILCVGCNLLLGYAQDDPQRLVRAVEYLGVVHHGT